MEFWSGGEGVTLQSLQAEIIRIAEDQPDHVYDSSNGCLYTHNIENFPTPGCIVGVAVYNITGKMVRQFQDGGDDDVNVSMNSDQWCALLGGIEQSYGEYVHKSVEAKRIHRWLTRVQTEQDTSTPWGRAVEIANELYAS